ncbi:MAG TPA: class I adenylate-forming enzyme family protein [Thermoanaerobaculia bacterium]|nr:class I adenylate-forming enzyme family protein [Thermoanaerobaculia bacterium]
MIQDALLRQASLGGERPCLLEGGRTFSYSEVAALAGRFAGWLAGRGLPPGGRVALLLGNSHRYVAALLGTLAAGGIAVPLHPLEPGSVGNAGNADGAVGPPSRLAAALAGSGAALLVTEERHLALAAAIPGRPPIVCLDPAGPLPVLPTLPTPVEPLHLGELAAAPPPRGRGEAATPALLLYTSGSTGVPKGVVLTHGNVVASTEGVLSYLRLDPGDRGLAVLPFPYVYGQSVLLTHLAAGASLALPSRASYPQVVLRELSQLGVTGLSGVPSTFLLLLGKGDFTGLTFPRLRYLTVAGGALPEPAVADLARCFPAARIFLMYGATEAAGRISYLPPERLADKPGSIGIPIPGVEMRVVRAGRPAPPGEEGEIEVRGATLSPGTWPLAAPNLENPENTGWYAPGDLGYRDEDGFFYLTGRTSDLLKIGGYRVSAAEIERALYATGLVVECAVVGRPDALLGERAEAFAVPRGPAVEAAAVLARLAGRLPAHQLPARLHLVPDLPRTASGKIAKRALPELP